VVKSDRFFASGLFISVFLSGVFVINESKAQEHCNSLLDQGVKNIQTSYDESHKFEYNFNKYCRVNLDEQSDSFAAEAEASVFLSWSGSGSGNSQRSRKRVQSWCDENKSKFTNDTLKIARAETVSAAALNAWNSCQRLANKGVKVTLSSALRMSEVVSIHVDSTLDTTVKLQSIALEGFKCFVSGVNKNTGNNLMLINSSEGVERDRQDPIGVGSGYTIHYFDADLGATNINVNCRRKERLVTSSGPTIVEKYGMAHISLNTDVMQYALSYEPVVTDYVATPKHSVLAFANEECPAGWVPYELAQGRFIRGVDPKAKLDWKIVDGERVPRQFNDVQEDTLQHHTHTTKWHDAGSPPGGSRDLEYPSESGTPVPSSEGERGRMGEETRPKNVALLYCIRDAGDNYRENK
jgi:hypothetical protein